MKQDKLVINNKIKKYKTSVKTRAALVFVICDK